ncbi:MAG: putative membrane protein [Halioglobus sp.]|jgi:uncharacterized membrane protein
MKWLFRIGIFLVVLLAAAYFAKPHWEVSHRIVISAPPAVVWDVLTDLEQYPQWNRYSPKVEGLIAVGEVVWVEAHLGDEVQNVQNYVVSIIPEKELCWQSADWYGALARGLRCRWLEAQGDDKTVLVHHEIMSGPLAWLIEILYRERIEQGLQLVDESVADRSQFLVEQKL